MLYDTALLARAYLHAWQVTREPIFKQVVNETIDFVAREMTHPDGGFFSSLDADSEGEEGKFYLGTLEEIRKQLKENSAFFEAAYSITASGNWESKMVLQRSLDDSALAARFSLDLETVATKLTECHTKLLTARTKRVRPGTDYKVLTVWNGLMLKTAAEAARVFAGTDAGAKYYEMATRIGEFILNTLRPDGRLHRSWRKGKVTEEVFLEDYASLILGLLELYQTDFNNRWFTAAFEHANEIIERFKNPAGGFFDTPSVGEKLVFRPKGLQDNATPSGNVLACETLLQLAAYSDKGIYRDLEKQALKLISEPAIRYPTAFANWLAAADSALGNTKQIAVLGNTQDKDFQAMIQFIRNEYRPNVVVATSAFPPANDAPSFSLLKKVTASNWAAGVHFHKRAFTYLSCDPLLLVPPNLRSAPRSG